MRQTSRPTIQRPLSTGPRAHGLETTLAHVSVLGTITLDATVELALHEEGRLQVLPSRRVESTRISLKR